MRQRSHNPCVRIIVCSCATAQNTSATEPRRRFRNLCDKQHARVLQPPSNGRVIWARPTAARTRAGPRARIAGTRPGTCSRPRRARRRGSGRRGRPPRSAGRRPRPHEARRRRGGRDHCRPSSGCSARWPPRCCCSTLRAASRCSSACQRRRPRRGLPATASAGAIRPSWMGPCVSGVFLPTTRCAGGRVLMRANEDGRLLMRPSGVPRGRSTLG